MSEQIKQRWLCASGALRDAPCCDACVPVIVHTFDPPIRLEAGQGFTVTLQSKTGR